MIKLLHIIVCAAYKDGWGYQENILPRKHKELGYDVDIVTYDQHLEAGKKTTIPRTYLNQDGIPVHVLAQRKETWVNRIPKVRAIPALFMRKTIGLYEKLCALQPDIIFVHGVAMNDHYEVVRYMEKHTDVRLYVDNHADYYNTHSNEWTKAFLTKTRGARIANRLSQYARVMWGVTPWRVQFLTDMYRVPKEKVQLLVMGGDEKQIDFAHKNEIRAALRSKYHISDEAFVVITGGKIDRAKNIHLLIDAVKQLSAKKVYLLIFGKYEPDMLDYAEIEEPNIINVGWIPAEQSYNLFLSADLAVFPGTHSVLWEQACATGIPAVFQDWNGGFCHVDVGGNAILLKDISVSSLYYTIERLVFTDTYYEMQQVACTKGRETFAYIEIAKRAVEYQSFEGIGKTND